MKELRSALQFRAYRISEARFRYAPEYTGEDSSENLQLTFAKTTHVLEDNQNFRIDLKVTVLSSEEKESEPKVDIQVSISGLFTVMPQYDPKWEPNALAILFPYVRSFVSAMTAQTGVKPILLPTVNLAAMFEAKQREDETGQRKE